MASTKLTRSFSTAGNRKTYTISFWVKLCDTSTNATIINVGPYSGDQEYRFNFRTDRRFDFYDYGSSAYKFRYQTNRRFRDVNSWYHFVIAVDTTQSTNSDRVKVYVNGTLESNYYIETHPSQNLDTNWNVANNWTIGATESGNHTNGSISHFYFIDGIAYTPSTFGETDTTTGEWKAKTSPSVTYGTNGFFILKDGNSVTDQSGNGNNFTVAGGTLTDLKDNPDNVFATLNPLARRLTSNDPTYLNGNTTLQGQTVNGQNNNGLATLGDLAKGKYYFECKIQTIGDNCGVGIVDTPDPSNGIPEGSHEIFYSNDGNKWNGSGYVSYGATYTTGDIIGCAFDVTSGTVEFYKNGVSQGTAATDLATNLNYGYTPMGYTNKGVMNFNFGNGYFGTTAVTSAQNPTDGIGIFEYTPPTNYRAVCTKSINAQEYS